MAAWNVQYAEKETDRIPGAIIEHDMHILSLIETTKYLELKVISLYKHWRHQDTNYGVHHARTM